MGGNLLPPPMPFLQELNKRLILCQLLYTPIAPREQDYININIDHVG
jgi:hypothetical protein